MGARGTGDRGRGGFTEKSVRLFFFAFLTGAEGTLEIAKHSAETLTLGL
jgi:hypothetical protein